MSHHHEAAPPVAEKFDPARGAATSSVFAAMAILGASGMILTLCIDPRLFAYSWLFGFAFAFTMAGGALFWVCLQHATDSEWSIVVRRQMENLLSWVRWVPILFIPVAVCTFFPNLLYKWMATDPKTDPLLAAKSSYLNIPFWWVRVIAIFGSLMWVAASLRRRSQAQDADGAAVHTHKLRCFGVGGIPVIAIGLTFGAIDWFQALNHHWYSTMWGVYIFAGAVGASMAALVLLVTWLKSLGYLAVVNEEHYHIMGKFLFAFTIFWAYIGYSQYMLIAYANIPEETVYFAIRNTAGWFYLSLFLVVGRFFVPFLFLLFAANKRASGRLVPVAVWIILMQLLDLFLVILPEHHRSGVTWQAALAAGAAALTMIGTFGWILIKNLGNSYLFPIKDPRLAASLKLTN
jgi:hypothetical protein